MYRHLTSLNVSQTDVYIVEEKENT